LIPELREASFAALAYMWRRFLAVLSLLMANGLEQEMWRTWFVQNKSTINNLAETVAGLCILGIFFVVLGALAEDPGSGKNPNDTDIARSRTANLRDTIARDRAGKQDTAVCTALRRNI